MSVDKKSFKAIVEVILSLEDRRKEIADEIKETIDAYADEHQVDKGAMKKAIAQYKQYLKDAEKFTATDHEVDELRGLLMDLG